MERMDHGKSTLAKLIAGLIKPTTGEVLVDNVNTAIKRNSIKLRQNIGIVFQNPENQILFNNVYDDIAFALKNLGLDNIEERIKTSLEKVKMKEYIKSETYELSLGQKQRVTIAGVLSINPKYLIFDEPTTMIDSEGKEDIYKIIKLLKQQGYTIIYITNAVDEILMSDRILILNEGKISSDFNKKNIIENVAQLAKNNIKIPKLIQTILELKENKINIDLQEWTQEELNKKLIEVCKK